MKKFILGVGAQKAGTTWLHRYFRSFDCFDPGFAKEYHVFDALTLPECPGVRDDIQAQALAELGRGFDKWKDAATIKQIAMLSDTEYYFFYFNKILHKDGVQFSADITPTYSGLSAETLSYIKAGFQKRRIEVLPIFLMREPVSRLNSMVKMRFRENGIVASKEQELDAMRQLCGSAHERIRSDYQFTYRNLEEVFGDHKFVGFYENLFTDAEIDRLCQFLGLPRNPANFKKRINQSPSLNKFDESELRAFRQHYEDQYLFVEKQFSTQCWRPMEAHS